MTNLHCKSPLDPALLADYWTEDLDVEQEDVVEEHLMACETCSRELGIPITWRSSGGASDGNKLAAAGLPVIDTLGPIGAHLHSPSEYLVLPSLQERAKLATLILLKLATGQLPPP